MLNQVFYKAERVFTLMFLLLLSHAAGREAALGKDFYFAVMQFQPSTFDSSKYSLKMTVSNPTNLNLEAKVQYYMNLPGQNTDTSAINSKDTATFDLASDLILQGADKHSKYVHVTTDQLAIVQVHMEYNSTDLLTSGSFSVLPRPSLTEDYIVATHCATGNCILLVTSVEYNAPSEEVTVTLRISPENASATYRGANYSDGDVIVETNLGEGKSMQVICSQCDLTGSYVESRRDVAVFAGGELTKLSGQTRGDLVMDQMMPKESIGRKYVLGTSLETGPLGEIIKVVPLKNGTSFSFKGLCYTASMDRQVFIFRRKRSEVVEILADDKVLVAQFVNTAFDDRVLNLPVPVYQWATSYWVYTPPVDASTDPADSVYISVISDPGTADHLEIVPSDGSSKLNTTLTSAYELTTVVLQHGTGLLREVKCTHLDCRPFSARLVHSKTGRASSITLRNSIPNFVPNAQDADEVTAACSDDLTTSAATSQGDFSEASTGNTEVSSNRNAFLSSTEVGATHTSEIDNTSQTSSDIITTTDDAITSSTAATGSAASSVSGENVITTTSVSKESTDREVLPSSSQTNVSEVNTIGTTVANTSDSSSLSTGDTTPTPSCCECVHAVANNSLSPEEVEHMDKISKTEINVELLIDKTTLSKYIRTKQSAKDERKSSQAIGTTVGIVIFSSFFAFIFCSDLAKLFSCLAECKRRFADKGRQHDQQSCQP